MTRVAPRRPQREHTAASLKRRKSLAPKAKAAPSRKRPAAAVPPSATTAPSLPVKGGLEGRRQDVVGVRELRQNLSVYLDRVKQGEALQVTEHGHVVAVLRPVPPNASRIDILIAQGLVTPATRSLRDLPPPRKAPPGTPSMSEILDEMRNEERY